MNILTIMGTAHKGNTRAVVDLFLNEFENCFNTLIPMVFVWLYIVPNLNEDSLIEIFATRSNERINQIKQRYFQLFNQKDLVKEINDETSGFFRKILLELLNANRSTNTIPDNNECGDCAKRLYNSQFDKKDTRSLFRYIYKKVKRRISKYFKTIL